MFGNETVSYFEFLFVLCEEVWEDSIQGRDKGSERVFIIPIFKIPLISDGMFSYVHRVTSCSSHLAFGIPFLGFGGGVYSIFVLRSLS